MTTTDSGAAHGSPRNTERVNTTMDPETRLQLERLRDLLPANPTTSQVIRYAIRELYLRETTTLKGYAEHAYHATLGKD